MDSLGFDFDDLLDILDGNAQNTSDVTEDTSISNVNTDNTEVEKVLTDDEEADKKLEEIRSIAKSLNTSLSNGNTGSGDLDKDILDWFDGKSPLPSVDLNNYVTNPNIKMSYGLSRNTLANFDMMGNLRKFINSSFEYLFSDTALMGLAPDELLDRLKVGFTIYKDLSTLNSRTILTLNEQRYKNMNESTSEVDKLSMLLSSIPSDKLQKILEDLGKG